MSKTTWTRLEDGKPEEGMEIWFTQGDMVPNPLTYSTVAHSLRKGWWIEREAVPQWTYYRDELPVEGDGVQWLHIEGNYNDDGVCVRSMPRDVYHPDSRWMYIHKPIPPEPEPEPEIVKPQKCPRCGVLSYLTSTKIGCLWYECGDSTCRLTGPICGDRKSAAIEWNRISYDGVE